MTAGVVSVDLDRLDGDRARVGWSLDGNCREVLVGWGFSPEGVDHEHTLTVDAASGEVVLEGLPAGPLYVSVSPAGQGGAVVAGLRNLGLRGPTNFRDMGGYRTADGSRVRWGRVYRSDALVLDEGAFDDFAALGMKAVYDLRSDIERETSPNRLPSGDYEVHHLPLVGESSARAAIMDGLTDGEWFLSQLYVQMLEHSAAGFGRILAGLGDESALPAVFHCAAGKDRTGMVAAVLLLTLGVDEEVVLDDYELTSRYRTPGQVRSVMDRLGDEATISAEAVAGILRTPRWAMKQAVAEIENRYGGIEGYLGGPAGGDPGLPKRLRQVLLTP